MRLKRSSLSLSTRARSTTTTTNETQTTLPSNTCQRGAVFQTSAKYSFCLNNTSSPYHDALNPHSPPLHQRIRPVSTRAHKPNSNHHFSTPSIIISTSSSHRSILSVDSDVFCDNAICSCLSGLCRHIFSCAFEWFLGRAGVMVGS